MIARNGLLLLSTVLSLWFATACRSTKPTQLCDGFQSYESPQSVRSQLGALGVWKEKLQEDPRGSPPYRLLTMSGPFTLSGVDGELLLIFYNDRLMECYFTTGDGPRLISAFRELHHEVPRDAGAEITIDRRTKFRYIVIANGLYRFVWTDPSLEGEHTDWMKRYG